MNVDLNSIAFLSPGERISLPETFDYDGYLETEHELNMLFPEVRERRVNFIQVGLTAAIYAEQPDTATPLDVDETYVLMPDRDSLGVCMRPFRMRPVRRMTVIDYRMAHLTAIKLIGRLNEAATAIYDLAVTILGDEVSTRHGDVVINDSRQPAFLRSFGAGLYSPVLRTALS